MKDEGAVVVVVVVVVVEADVRVGRPTTKAERDLVKSSL